MALSNWDTLAVDETGAPLTDPLLTTAGGVSFVFYKNWVYVRSPELWFPGCGFTSPTIAQIDEGEVRIGGASLLAVRGPRDGIYALVTEQVHNGEGWRQRAMIGCACEAYVGDTWTGVGEAEVAFLQAFLRERADEFGDLDLGRAVRHNQGDAFFAGRFGIETPSSAPGRAEEPLFLDALEGMKRRLGDGD